MSEIISLRRSMERSLSTKRKLQIVKSPWTAEWLVNDPLRREYIFIGSTFDDCIEFVDNKFISDRMEQP